MLALPQQGGWGANGAEILCQFAVDDGNGKSVSSATTSHRLKFSSIEPNSGALIASFKGDSQQVLLRHTAATLGTISR